MKEQINQIKERNNRVEADKAWETSNARKIIIAVMTYVVVVIFLLLIKVPNAWLNALIPTLGFLLSTLSLPFFKKYWLNNFYKN
ncbi:hypothetical protein KA107_03400 [Candidatus Pacearchaeota archaeon]|nr:hypothetical protein [Candidatus Pacearchaeota archaeon]